MSVNRNVKPTLATRLEARSWRSPDFDALRFKKEIIIFVYDNLKRNTLENSKYLKGSKYLGKAMTLSSFYCMKNGVDFPVVFEEKVTAHACIRGEAYLISPQHILALDDLQQNNVYVNRVLQKIILLEQANSRALDGTGHHYLKHRWSHGFMYVAHKNMFDKAKLESRSTRQSKIAADAVTGRPYYEWDTWEAEWPLSNIPAAGSMENNYPGWNGMFGFHDGEFD